MAIQNRRGNFVDFNPAKMLPGEWAVVQNGDPSSNSGTSIYMCFSVGNVKRMATYEDMVENINLATADVQAMFTADVQAAILAATQATAGANTVISNAQNAIADTNAAISRADVATANAVAVYEQLKDIDVAQLQDDINNLAEVARTGNSIDVNYNSLGSELEAINVQTAIDELSAKNSDLANTIDDFSAVNQATIPINTAVFTAGDMIVVKSGNVATLLILGTLKTWTANQTLGTLPAGFRPVIATRAAVNQYSAVTNGVAAMVTVTPAGNIGVANMQNNWQFLVGSIVYICS